jgi:hypothetical protein
MLAASQAPEGDRSAWAYNLPEIYFIALLEEFSVEDTSDGNYVRDICLVNRYTGKIFYEGLGYIFLELVNFVKEEAELESNLDKWLYVLKNISRMDKIPLFMRKTIFEKVFSIAEYSNMTKEEKTMYNAALKRKWDNHSVMVEAIRDAVEKERAKAEEKLAKAEKEKEQLLLDVKEKERLLLHVKERLLLEAKAEKKKSVEILKRMGMPVKDIAKVVGLSEKEIEQL